MKPWDASALLKELEKLQRFRRERTERSVRNLSFVPAKATIRLEYMRCGKRNCKKCFQVSNHDYTKPHFYHGPYFCAYWRDEKNQGKLKKKYIGEWAPDLDFRLNMNGKHVGQWNPLLGLTKKVKTVSTS